jgi:hypothetical protein
MILLSCSPSDRCVKVLAFVLAAVHRQWRLCASRRDTSGREGSMLDLTGSCGASGQDQLAQSGIRN